MIQRAGVFCVVALGVAFACSSPKRDFGASTEVGGTGGGGGSSGKSDGVGMAGEAGNSSSFGGEDSLGGQGPDPFGGADDGGAPAVDGPPEVKAVAPKDGASDVSPTAPVSLLFSEALAPATVTGNTIKVQDAGTAVAGDVSLSSLVATFTPTSRLSLLASYDASVSQGVTDVAGTPLKAAFGSTFKVREGAWTDKDTFFDAKAWAAGDDVQRVVSDDAGNLLAVWTAPNANGVRSTFARWYRVDSGWKPATELESNGQASSRLVVAASPEGDAVAAWYTVDGSKHYVARARRFVNGTWEASAQNVGQQSASDPFNQLGDANPAVAIRGGQVLVAWNRAYLDDNTHQISAALNVATTQLTSAWPSTPANVYSQTISAIAVVLDDDANALLTFRWRGGANGVGDGIYYARKPATGAWQAPVLLPQSYYAYGLSLATDGDGAVVVWDNGSSVDEKIAVRASRYTRTGQFETPVIISSPDLKLNPHVTGVVSNGKSYYVSWLEYVAAGIYPFTRRYEIATGKWDATPTPLSDGLTPSLGNASIGVDGHGNAIAVFDEQTSKDSVRFMFTRLVSGGTWSKAVPLSEAVPNYTFFSATVAKNGVAALVYHEGGVGTVPLLGGRFRVFK